jgi:hypothetical protein
VEFGPYGLCSECIVFGVHIDREHAYTLYKILVLSDNYLLMLHRANVQSVDWTTLIR